MRPVPGWLLLVFLVGGFWDGWLMCAMWQRLSRRASNEIAKRAQAEYEAGGWARRP